MDGTALSRAIREPRRAGYAYVIVLTGAADEEAARATMEAGADDLLLKPLDAAQLERKLIAAGRVTALHRRLHDDARHDTLTGLGNRLRLAEDLEVAVRPGRALRPLLLRRAVRHRRLQGLQRRPPATGRATTCCAPWPARCSEQIRTGDAVYRYGGEEFLVLLPEQSLESATPGRRAPAGGRRGAAPPPPGRRRRHRQRGRRRARRQGRAAPDAAVRARRPGALPGQGGRPQPRRGPPRPARCTAERAIRAADRRRRPGDPPHPRRPVRTREPGLELVGEAEDADAGDRAGGAPPPRRGAARLRHARRRRLRAAIDIREASPDATRRRAERRRQPGRAVRHVPRRGGRLRRQGRAGRGDRPRDPQLRALVLTARP